MADADANSLETILTRDAALLRDTVRDAGAPITETGPMRKGSAVHLDRFARRWSRGWWRSSKQRVGGRSTRSPTALTRPPGTAEGGVELPELAFAPPTARRAR